MAAFGSLALSHDPGTAQMGMLLSISLGCTLFCTLIVLPRAARSGPSAAAERDDRGIAWRSRRKIAVEQSARLRRVGGGRR